MDVAKPGTSAPDASARPVIVGHRTLLQDPMVTPAQNDEDKAEEVTVSKTAPTLKPLNEPAPKKVTVKSEEKEDEDDTTESAPAYVIESVKPKAEEPKEDSKPEEPEKKPEPKETSKEKEPPEKSEPEVATEQPKTDSDEAATEAVAEQAAAKKTTEKEDKEAAARQEAVQKLITEKTYNLPIGEAKRKRNMSLILLLLLLLLLVLAYFAIDAGVIKTSISLPFEFFK